jgi:hypothetical protein
VVVVEGPHDSTYSPLPPSPFLPPPLLFLFPHTPTIQRRAASELEVTALCSSDEYTKVCEKAGLVRGDSGALAPIVVMAN